MQGFFIPTEDFSILIENILMWFGWLDVENGDKHIYIPCVLIFYPSYPNPFNPTTAISFELRDAGFASLCIFNVQGRQVDCLKYGQLSAGKHEFTFDGSGLASGIYFAKLEAGDFQQMMKLLVK